MNRFRCFLVGTTVLIGATSFAAVQSHHHTTSDSAFEQLTTLAGEWEAVQDGTSVAETYTVTANGSALLVETKPANESPMITMITVDGDRLIATHYCSAGNQPHMVNSAPGDLRKGLTFSLERVTGLKTPGDWHNTGLTIVLDDHDHMTQHWTYMYKGQSGTTDFHYTRKR
jgi:flagellin-like hook-associated protein FlgL